MTTPNPSPALEKQCADYPVRFNGGVPKTVRMAETVQSELWTEYAIFGYRELIAHKGQTYPCWVNSHGAVAVFTKNGEMLGVKPREFEVVEWHPLNCCPGCGMPSGDGSFHAECQKAASAEIKAMNDFVNGSRREPLPRSLEEWMRSADAKEICGVLKD